MDAEGAMGRLWGAVLAAGLVVGAQPAWAQSKVVAKAEKSFAKAQAGDSKALDKAWELVGEAKAHPETRDDAKTWVLLADLTAARMKRGDTEVGAKDVLDAWDAAIGKDAEKAWASKASEALLTLASTEAAMGTNAYEGDRMQEALDHFDLARRGFALARQVGPVDETRSDEVLQLTVLAAVGVGDLHHATTVHAELEAAGGARPGTTLAVAKALGKKDPKQALAFLGPVADAHPDDAALFDGRIALLLAAGDTDGARAVLAAGSDRVGNAMGITLSHARAWAGLEDWDAAAKAYGRAFEMDPKHPDVLRGYAEVEIARARAASALAETTKKWAERKAARDRKAKAFASARDLLQAAREVDPNHLPTLERLREVWEEVPPDDREEIDALDQAILAAKSPQ